MHLYIVGWNYICYEIKTNYKDNLMFSTPYKVIHLICETILIEIR